MLERIREIQPKIVVGENVSGLISWNGGLVFDEVQTDLEAEGFEVIPFVLPACGVNAPHRRDRVWFVAYRNECKHTSQRKDKEIKGIRSGNNGEPEAGIEQTKRVNGFYGLLRPNPHTPGNRRIRQGEGITLQTGWEPRPESTGKLSGGFEGSCCDGPIANASNTGLQGRKLNGTPDTERQEQGEQPPRPVAQFYQIGDWADFPTQPPVRGKYDGISESMVRNLNPKIYATISERYTDEDLQEVFNAFQSPEVRQQVRGLYQIHDEGILLKVLQLCSPANTEPKGFSVFSEKASEGLMRKLRKCGTFANSPQGRELEKQFTREFANTLPYLSHEIALVAMEAERATVAFNSWHRNESIKAYGNAIVPQIVYQIFQAIQQFEEIQ